MANWDQAAFSWGGSPITIDIPYQRDVMDIPPLSTSQYGFFRNAFGNIAAEGGTGDGTYLGYGFASSGG